MNRLVFTGCGRSGTGYVARTLQSAGVPCTHEGVFQGEPEPEDQLPWNRTVAESSWFAAPFLRSYPPPMTVVHLVRNPPAWVDSWLRSRVKRYPTVRAYLRRWCPESLVEDSPVRDAVRFWLAWNRRVQRMAHVRLRIEDLSLADLDRVLARSGRSRAERPGRVPRTYNRKGGPPRRLTWAEMPSGKLRKEARAMAEEYGYL